MNPDRIMIMLERVDGFEVAVSIGEIAALDVDADSGGTIIVLRSGHTITVEMDVAGVLGLIDDTVGSWHRAVESLSRM